MTVKRYTPTQCCEHDGTYVTYSDYQKLAAEGEALKNRTVKVPAKVYVKDMKSNVVRWAQVIDALSDSGVAFVRDDGELIAGTRETPATDAAIAEIKSEEAQNMYESILDNPSVYDMESLVDCLESYAENKKAFAANLRAGGGKG